MDISLSSISKLKSLLLCCNINVVYKFIGGQSSGANKSCIDLNAALCKLLRPGHQTISAGQCWQAAMPMWPPDAAGPWSPVVRVISLRSVAWHNTQHQLSSLRRTICQVQWGSLHPVLCQYGVVSVPAVSVGMRNCKCSIARWGMVQSISDNSSI